MKSDTLKLLLVVSVLLVKMHDKNVLAFQGYYFSVLEDTSLIAGTEVATLRNVMECALHCISVLGQGICKTASFHKTSRVCQMSSDEFVSSAVQQDFDSVTVKYVGEGTPGVDCGSPTTSNPNLSVKSALSYSTLNGSSLAIGCQAAGYTPSSGTIQCDSDGTWQPMVTCSPVDCGQPVISNGNMGPVASVYGTVVTVECGAGYTATNSNITCQASGTWSLTECSKDCGTYAVTSAMTSYANGTTYVGSIATVTCNTNYALTDINVTAEMVCTAAGWTPQNGITPVCWELMFRGSQGNGFDLTDIYQYGSASSHITGMTTSHPVCQNVFATNCNLHYRNPHLDDWESLNIQQVRYELYNGSETVMSLTVGAAGSTMMNWLGYGKTYAIHLPWTDINLGATWWAIFDWDTAEGRSFRVIENYGACTGDILYMFVLFEPSRSNGSPLCHYDQYHTTWPQFMYTLNNVKSNFQPGEYGLATTMAVWVLHA